MTLACRGSRARRSAARPARPPTFRIYLSDDVAGAEVGGAVKNVLAIACGVVEGRGLGQNARAALIARGFAEMTRFGLAKGARRETLAGLSGLGDLVLTCSSTSSRNFSLGKGIGEGRPAAELMADRRTVAEGAFTAPVLARLAEQMGIDMPIVVAVDDAVGKARVVQLLEMLSRPPGARGTRNRPRCPSSPNRRSASGRAFFLPRRRPASDGRGLGYRRKWTDRRAILGWVWRVHRLEDDACSAPMPSVEEVPPARRAALQMLDAVLRRSHTLDSAAAGGEGPQAGGPRAGRRHFR